MRPLDRKRQPASLPGHMPSLPCMTLLEAPLLDHQALHVLQGDARLALHQRHPPPKVGHAVDLNHHVQAPHNASDGLIAPADRT